MKTLNYALAGGDKVLMRGQSENGNVLLQVWYQDVTAADLAIEIGISTNINGPYAKVVDAGKALVPGDDTAYVSLAGLSNGYIEVKLIAPADTAGTLTKVDSVGLTNLAYP